MCGTSSEAYMITHETRCAEAMQVVLLHQNRKKSQLLVTHRCWSPTPCWRRLEMPRHPGTTTPHGSESSLRSHLMLGVESQELPSPRTCWNAPEWCQSAPLSALTTSSTSCVLERRLIRDSSSGVCLADPVLTGFTESS